MFSDKAIKEVLMKGKLVKTVLMAMVFSCLTIGLAVAAPTLDSVVKKGTLVVATDMTAVPMQFRDASGKPTGFTVELLELAAKEMGVKIEWQDTSWESLIPSLLSGKVDMIAANMSITLSRLKSVRFSDPYFNTGIVVLAKKSSSLKNWKDCADPSVKMGATMGSVHADFIQKTWGKKPSQYENLVEYLTDLKAGRIDAVMEDEMVCADIIKKNPDLKILSGYVRPDCYGLTFRQDQDSNSLVNWFNWFLKWEKLNGNYAKLYQQYVGIEWAPALIVD
jgi:polar amino acid transport system substrate-binding protein